MRVLETRFYCCFSTTVGLFAHRGETQGIPSCIKAPSVGTIQITICFPPVARTTSPEYCTPQSTGSMGKPTASHVSGFSMCKATLFNPHQGCLIRAKPVEVVISVFDLNRFSKKCNRQICLDHDQRFYLSNGLFFFERCSLITATVCAYKLNNARQRVRKICLHIPLQL